MVVFNRVIISCSALHAPIHLPTPTQLNADLLQVQTRKNIYFLRNPPSSPSLTTSVFFFDTQNPVKLAPFVKCWLWVDKLACLRQDTKPTVINHNYRVGLAHGSCINIPLPPSKIHPATPPYHLPALFEVAWPPFGGQYTACDNAGIIYPSPLPPFY